MPEGPEVKIVGEWLSRRLVGQALGRAEILSGRYQRHGPFAQSWNPDAPVLSVRSKGKLIAIEVDSAGDPTSANHLLCTLGMTGGWSRAASKHSRVLFRIGGCPLYFEDIRNFGTLKACTLQDYTRRWSSLGLDPLADAGGLSAADFHAQISRAYRRRNWRLAELLLDQRYICGVGNYARAEILYAAGLSPWRNLDSITEIDTERLRLAVNEVMWASYRAGGASLATWYSPDGARGTFQDQMCVYNRSQCPAGTVVASELDYGGRRMWWVPAVQQ